MRSFFLQLLVVSFSTISTSPCKGHLYFSGQTLKHSFVMASQQGLLFSFFCFSLMFLLSGNMGVHASRHLFHSKPSKLFVFGDSYVDTGNNRKAIASSWKIPYGVTFPGKPAGRYSDGRVLTDYIARFIGVKSPIPYRWRNVVEVKHFKRGVNFAYGGTGVFDTTAPYPNMTTQIDFFQQMINDKIFTQGDLQCSAALVSLAGNDYNFYLANNGSAQGFPAFIQQVVNQLALNLKRILDLGVKRVVVTGLQPLGCLPSSTAQSSFRQCNGTQNQLVGFHNTLLKQAVAKLNANAKPPTFLILDLYSAFTTVFKNKGEHPGSTRFSNPLQPCCVGVSSTYSCGTVDDKGAKMYTACEEPKSAFFWDVFHPTQEGWRAVYSALRANLQEL